MNAAIVALLFTIDFVIVGAIVHQRSSMKVVLAVSAALGLATGIVSNFFL